MRKVILLTVALCTAFVLQAQFSKAVLQATGLTCAMCNNAINKALKEVPFIESVRSDIKNSAFNIVFKAGSTVDIDAMRTAVEDAGFSVGGLKLTGSFDGVKVANDQHVKVGSQTFHFVNVQEQVLNGEVVISVVDKNFITEKQFKKMAAATKMSCMQTGKAGDCCTKAGIPEGTRIYHVTI